MINQFYAVFSAPIRFIWRMLNRFRLTNIHEDDLFQVIYVISRESTSFSIKANKETANKQILAYLDSLIKRISIGSADEVLQELVSAICQFEYTNSDEELSRVLFGIGKASIFASNAISCIGDNAHMLSKIICKCLSTEESVPTTLRRQCLFALANLLYYSASFRIQVHSDISAYISPLKSSFQGEACTVYALAGIANLSRTIEIRIILGREGYCLSVSEVYFQYVKNETICLYVFMAIGNLAYHCIDNVNRFVKHGFVHIILETLKDDTAGPLLCRSCIYALCLCLYTTEHIKPQCSTLFAAESICFVLQKYQRQVDISIFALHIIRLIASYDVMGNRIWNQTSLFEILTHLLEFRYDLPAEDSQITFEQRGSYRLSRLRTEIQVVKIRATKAFLATATYPSSNREKILQRLGYKELLTRAIVEDASFPDPGAKAEVEELVRHMKRRGGWLHNLWRCNS